MSLKDAFVSQSLKTIPIDLSKILDLGGKRAYAREMTALERGKLLSKIIDREGNTDVMKLLSFDHQARLIIDNVVDSEGNPVFGADDLPVVQNISGKAAQVMVEAVMEASGLTEAGGQEGVAEAKG